jgi:hypothetical protein
MTYETQVHPLQIRESYNRKHTTEETIHSENGNSSDSNDNSRSRENDERTCYHCRLPSYFKVNCFHHKRTKAQHNKSTNLPHLLVEHAAAFTSATTMTFNTLFAHISWDCLNLHHTGLPIRCPQAIHIYVSTIIPFHQLTR